MSNSLTKQSVCSRCAVVLYVTSSATPNIYFMGDGFGASSFHTDRGYDFVDAFNRRYADLYKHEIFVPCNKYK